MANIVDAPFEIVLLAENLIPGTFCKSESLSHLTYRCTLFDKRGLFTGVYNILGDYQLLNCSL